MLGGAVVGCLCLHRRSDGSVDVAAGDGTLLEEPFALLGSAVGDLKIGLGLVYIELSLLHIFGNSGECSGGKGGLRLAQAASGVKRRAAQVAVFER